MQRNFCRSFSLVSCGLSDAAESEDWSKKLKIENDDEDGSEWSKIATPEVASRFDRRRTTKLLDYCTRATDVRWLVRSLVRSLEYRDVHYVYQKGPNKVNKLGFIRWDRWDAVYCVEVVVVLLSLHQIPSLMEEDIDHIVRLWRW